MFRHRPARPLALRALALASALSLLLAGSADAYGLPRCAHHDAPPALAAAGPSDGSAGHAGHGGRADGPHAAAVAGHAQDHLVAGGHDHDDAEHGDACSCVGECAGAAAVPSTQDPPSVAVAPLSTDVPAPDGLPAVRQIERLLPPANGPPSLT